MAISLEVPVGDVIDRATILFIKIQMLPVGDARANCQKQYDYIKNMWNQYYKNDITDSKFFQSLFIVNRTLWDLEDKIRAFETSKAYDEEFIRVARQIHISNDSRAAIKRKINLFYQSNFIEEKYYKEEK